MWAAATPQHSPVRPHGRPAPGCAGGSSAKVSLQCLQPARPPEPAVAGCVLPSILCYSWVCGPDPSPVVWAKLHTALDSVLKPSHVRRLLGLACEDELALLYRAWIAPTGQTNSYKPILTRMYIKDPRESSRPVSHHESRPMLVQLCHQQVVVLGWGESVEMPKQQEKAVLHWEALWHCGCVGTTLSRRHSRNGGSRGRSADEGRRVAAGPGARKLACQKGGGARLQSRLGR